MKSPGVETLEKVLAECSARCRELAAELASLRSQVKQAEEENRRLRLELRYGTETGEPCAEIISLRSRAQGLVLALEKWLPLSDVTTADGWSQSDQLKKAHALLQSWRDTQK